MITEKQLRDYARKIYEQRDGYTIEKAYELFPRYAPRIQIYLLDFTIEEEEKSFLKDVVNTTLTLEFLARYFYAMKQKFERLKKTVIIYQSKLKKMKLDEQEQKAILKKNQLLYVEVYKTAIEWRKMAIAKASYLGEENLIPEYQKSIKSYDLLIAKANKKLKELL